MGEFEDEAPFGCDYLYQIKISGNRLFIERIPVEFRRRPVAFGLNEREPSEVFKSGFVSSRFDFNENEFAVFEGDDIKFSGFYSPVSGDGDVPASFEITHSGILSASAEDVSRLLGYFHALRAQIKRGRWV